jgi:outer membrane protein assembly factor BamE (lipoprotein component of BamABCDE complex)
MVGMTKEQVITSLGYPLPTKTPNMDSNVWRYSQNSTVQYDVRWENERVSQVIKAIDDKGGLPVIQPTKPGK